MASEHHLMQIAAPPFDPSCTSCFGSSSMASCWSSNIGGYDWQCNYATNSSRGMVSLILVLPHGNIREPLNARFKFSLLDREGRQVPSRTRASSFQNWSTPHRWEWTCDDFITKEDLERPEYLRDGYFTVRCDIALKPFAARAADAFVTVPPSDLHKHLSNLLECQEGSDVTFRIEGSDDVFHAHRCVLAARSLVFRAQLFGEMKESKQTVGSVVVEIQDMEAKVFSSLLRFVYTDSLPEADEKVADEDDGPMVHYQRMLVAADRYGLERMKLICQEKLCSHICANSVGSMLALADQYHCPGLKEACFDFLSSSTNLDLFTETDGFEVLTDSCPAVLKELLAKLATVLIFE